MSAWVTKGPSFEVQARSLSNSNFPKRNKKMSAGLFQEAIQIVQVRGQSQNVEREEVMK